jgi:hypothetical protein
MIGSYLNGIAPLPDVFPVIERDAADQVLFLLWIVVVQINSAIPDGCPGVSLADRSLPKDLGPPRRPASIKFGFL